jgi:hypothetical protein
MKQRRRIYFSAAQGAEIWDRWQAGESMKSVDEVYRTPVRSRVLFGFLSDLAGWRHPPCRTATGAQGAQSRRVGGDIARAQYAVFVAFDRPHPGSIAVHDRPRSSSQWRS